MADILDPVITAEIVAAKNKLVTQSNRAEVIVDGWEATGNLVKDAPNDGQAYTRKYGVWALAESGGGVGDMVKVVYDPQGKEADAFARVNHTGEQAIGTITGLSTSLASKVPEAPVDGKQYARKDAGWEEVVASGGGGVDYFAPIYAGASPFDAPITISSWKAVAAGNYTRDYARNSMDAEAFKYRGFPKGDNWAGEGVSSTFYYTVQDDPTSVGDKIIYVKDKLGYGEFQLLTKGQTGSSIPVWRALVPRFADHPVPSLAIQGLTNVESVTPNTVGQVLTVLGANSVGFRDPTGGGGGSTATDLSITYTSSAAVIANTNGTGVTIASAASGTAGLLSAGNFVKLGGIGTGANKNVQADWNQTNTSNDSYILNKPTLGTIARFDDVASSAINYVRTRAAWVDIATLGYIPEAPNDGKLYGRKGNAWVEIVLP